MIHFNALDFNVCRSEEVISSFWRSVYILRPRASEVVDLYSN